MLQWCCTSRNAPLPMHLYVLLLKMRFQSTSLYSALLQFVLFVYVCLTLQWRNMCVRVCVVCSCFTNRCSKISPQWFICNSQHSFNPTRLLYFGLLRCDLLSYVAVILEEHNKELNRVTYSYDYHRQVQQVGWTCLLLVCFIQGTWKFSSPWTW